MQVFSYYQIYQKNIFGIGKKIDVSFTNAEQAILYCQIRNGGKETGDFYFKECKLKLFESVPDYTKHKNNNERCL